MQLYVQEKIGLALGRFYQLSKRGWCKFGSSIYTELYGVLTKNITALSYSYCLIQIYKKCPTFIFYFMWFL